MILPTKNKVNPIIKWTGSKKSIAYKLSHYIPKSKRYLEPFVGGGSMLPFRKITNGHANDIIPELITLWKEIKFNPDLVVMEYKNRWEKLKKFGHEVYYEIRNDFNRTRNPHDFLFVTRTCVNGMIRFNSKGEFNNSFHLTRSGINPKRFEILIFEWSHYIRNVEFYNNDYKDFLSIASCNDFVFLDPPYKGTKDRYLRNNFNYEEFYCELDKLNSINAKWILTFDGNAGLRKYYEQIPLELYKTKLIFKTGHSPFTKMMRTNIDKVFESVYFNFEIF